MAAGDKTVRLSILADNQDALRKITELQADYELLKKEIDDSDLDPKFKAAATTAYKGELKNIAKDLLDVKSAAKDAEGAIGDVGKMAEGKSGGSLLSGNGGGLFGSLTNMLSMGGGEGAEGGSLLANPLTLALAPTAIGGAATALGALATAAVSAGGGFASLGILAMPTLTKITTAVDGGNKAIAKLPLNLQPAANAWKGFKGTFESDVNDFSGPVANIFTQGLKDATPLLSVMTEFASNAMPGVLTFMSKITGAFNTPVVKNLVQQLAQMSGPVIGALGSGIAGLIPDLARIFNIFSQKDVINAINISFRIIGGTLNFVAFMIKTTMGQFDLLMKVAKNVTHQVADGVDAVRESAIKLWGEIEKVGDWFGSAFKTAYNNVVHWGGIIIGYVKNIPSDITNLFENAGQWLWNAGYNIMMGLWNGISSVVGWVEQQVSNIGSDISSAFSSVLGIFSPSRVFIQHGKYIMQGLAMGITGNSHLATDAVRKVGSSLTLGGVGVKSGSGSSAALQMEWVGGGGADAEFITWLKKNIRVRGGNPAVLGR